VTRERLNGLAMPMEYKRPHRVADLILKELAEVLLHKVKDPRLTGMTLTGVEVTADLGQARVFYSLIGDDEAKVSAAAGLQSAGGFVRRELAKRLHLRRMPELVFRFDASLEYGSRMDRLLSELKESDSG